MARSDFLAIAIFVAVMVLAVTCDEVEPIKYTAKCWKCSYNAKDNKTDFCGDPFDASGLNDAQKSVYYIDCPPPPNRSIPQPNQRNICRKIKKIENDTVVIDRSCFWQETDKPKPCENENLPSHVKVQACELCDSGDGCNHSSRNAIQAGQIVTLMAIPLAIAKMFSF